MSAKLVSDESGSSGWITEDLPSDSSRNKFEAAHKLTVKLLQQIDQHGLKDAEFQLSQKVAECLANLVFKDKYFLEIFKTFKDYRPTEYTHSFLVCVISLSLAKRQDWTSQRTVDAVALGALLHDIGAGSLDPKLKSMPLKDMTPEELKSYKSHPEEGLRMASQIKGMPASVQQIILQHHECNGRGFPYELPDSKIYPLAKIVCLAEKFSNILIEKDALPIDGLKIFLANKMEVLQHDPELVKALIKSFIKDEKLTKEGK